MTASGTHAVAYEASFTQRYVTSHFVSRVHKFNKTRLEFCFKYFNNECIIVLQAVKVYNLTGRISAMLKMLTLKLNDKYLKHTRISN